MRNWRKENLIVGMRRSGHPETVFDLSTPALLLDDPRLEQNARRMRDKVRQFGVTLRPHVKTSKSIDVLRVLSGGEDVPITVSTLAEARYFFANGVTDILYAVGIAPVKLPEVAELVHSRLQASAYPRHARSCRCRNSLRPE